MKFYTGIGSRETPQEVLDVMRKFAYLYAKKGYVLRSGGAEGADTAFAEGWGDAWSESVNNTMQSDCKAEIYLPWNEFNGQLSTMEGRVLVTNKTILEQAEQIASEVHPAWGSCKQGARKLHTRNVFQVLGATLDKPSTAVLCYALVQGSSVKGGTRTAVEIAKKYDVPVFNLAEPKVFEKFKKYVEGK